METYSNKNCNRNYIRFLSKWICLISFWQWKINVWFFPWWGVVTDLVPYIFLDNWVLLNLIGTQKLVMEKVTWNTEHWWKWSPFSESWRRKSTKWHIKIFFSNQFLPLQLIWQADKFPWNECSRLIPLRNQKKTRF